MAACVPIPAGFPGCRHCPLRRAGRPAVCLDCLGRSAPVPSPGRRCACCGHLVAAGEACPMAWCGRRDRAWSVAFSLGEHTGGLRRAILRYKYGGERWWAGVFALLLAGFLDRHAGWVEDFDLLTAVPAYSGPGARRSWDPVGGIVAELARGIGAGWEVRTDVIRKRQETPAMVGNDLAARHAAALRLRSALVVPVPTEVTGRRILVVDDVLAEGSTLQEVALALCGAGAAEVAGLTLARGRWTGAREHRPAGA